MRSSVNNIRSFPDPIRPKSFYLERVRHHYKADHFICGTGWDGRRGSAVGCTLECYDHSLYPELLGIPGELAHIEDWIFENLTGTYLEWPERFLEAIPEGADLSGVYSKWSVRLLDRCLDRMSHRDQNWRLSCRTSLRKVRNLHAQSTDPGEAAWSTAWSDVLSAMNLEAKPATDSVALLTAWVTVWSTARHSAMSADIERQAEDLIELLSSAPQWNSRKSS